LKLKGPVGKYLAYNININLRVFVRDELVLVSIYQIKRIINPKFHIEKAATVARKIKI